MVGMNNRLLLATITVVVFLIGGFLLLRKQNKNNKPLTIRDTQTSKLKSTTSNAAAATVIAENLDTPWGIAFLPDKSMLVTERPGRVRSVNSKGVLQQAPALTLKDVREIGEGGLLGIAIHPDFTKNSFVYIFYTYNQGESTYNKVARYKYSAIKLAIACAENKSNCNTAKTVRLEEDKIIIDKIPAASNHNGGRIQFGPDGYLYITTGDAENSSQAQDRDSLAGKILRVADPEFIEGSGQVKVEVYSYGHRNAQGLAWDDKGRLWATEHGRSGLQSGLDELNLIEKGKNYGWPIIQGDEKKEGMETPRLNSGSDTWAPAGAAFVGDSLFFGGLRGQALYRATINDKQITLKEYFKGGFGRIRDVVKGPDGTLYITTSNRDGRGNPRDTDDRIIKINPRKL